MYIYYYYYYYYFAQKMVYLRKEIHIFWTFLHAFGFGRGSVGGAQNQA